MNVTLLDMGYLLRNAIVPYELGLGILMIADVFRRNDCNVTILDRPSDEISKDEWCNQIIVNTISSNPDIIAVSTRCDNYPFSINITKILKKQKPNVLILFGGPQATHTDIKTLEICPQVDIIVRGEGELTTEELIYALKNKRNLENVMGLTIRKDGKPYRTKERELIIKNEYEPAYEIVPKNYVKKLKKNKMRIEVGRGCPYSCVFCCTCKTWKAKVSKRCL